METLLSIPIIVSLLSLAFVAYLVFWIKKNGMGSKEMQDIYEAIKEGSNAFLKRQYKTIAIILAILSFALFELYTLTKGREAGVHIVVSFLLGAILSAISGLVGMWISTRSNIRSAAAAQTSFGRALEVAFRAGAVSGVTITA
ncbi:MAG TPA: sodium/proton-translocating pyrophosphatase, partial [Candidatus Pacearchaeota archaeon]|nr:sodium/proton-translocating pyrophosphatase [Candidatus Pacearchaeota archaeon]